MLLGNQGPVVSADGIEKGGFAADNLEATIKLIVLAGDRPVRHLRHGDIDKLNATFRLRG